MTFFLLKNIEMLPVVDDDDVMMFVYFLSYL